MSQSVLFNNLLKIHNICSWILTRSIGDALVDFCRLPHHATMLNWLIRGMYISYIDVRKLFTLWNVVQGVDTAYMIGLLCNCDLSTYPNLFLKHLWWFISVVCSTSLINNLPSPWMFGNIYFASIWLNIILKIFPVLQQSYVEAINNKKWDQVEIGD